MTARLLVAMTLSDAESMRCVRVPAGEYELDRIEHANGCPWYVLADTAIGSAGGWWENYARQRPERLALTL